MNLPGNEVSISRSVNTVDQPTLKRIRAKLHPPGTIVFPKIGGAIATNKRRILQTPSAIDNNILGITPSPDISHRWLFHCLSAIDFSQFQSGTSVPAIKQSVIGDILIPDIPLEYQEKIADFLDWILRKTPSADWDTAPVLPSSLDEQRRIVAKIEALAAKVEEARGLRKEVSTACHAMLMSAYQQIADGASRKPLSEVAPLDRRPVSIDVDATYPQVAVRSFGRGPFHKPPLNGSEITWQKPHLVHAGDILISNIKSWEGAIAVARPEDDGRYGSHRYLTFVPVEGVATARFLCFHLLSPEGLLAVGEASPGSADRNRTLNSKKFLQIEVPVPDFEKQVWFDQLCNQVGSLETLHSKVSKELDALLPSILDKAFKGEL